MFIYMNMAAEQKQPDAQKDKKKLGRHLDIGYVGLMSLTVKVTILGGKWLGLSQCELIIFRRE